MCRTCEVREAEGATSLAEEALAHEPSGLTLDCCEYNPEVRIYEDNYEEPPSRVTLRLVGGRRGFADAVLMRDSDDMSDSDDVCMDPECEGECNDELEDPPDGVPDEVLGPHGEWMSLDAWHHRVAVNWKRTGAEILPPSSGSGPAGPDTITFQRVVDYRVDSQLKYVEPVHCDLGLQISGLRRSNPDQRRDFILYSLGIMDPAPGDSEELLLWLESSIVQEPWNGYVRGYGEYLGAWTHNPLWPRVQWYLADSNRERGWSDWERLGYGDWSRPIDKSGWTHEDHACRFVLHFYDLLTHPELAHEHDIRRNLATHHRIGQWTAEAHDTHDKAWFGYALLCLLIRSWQYKQHATNSHFRCDQGLVPAMYEGYNPNIFIDYPLVQVGQLNLSPFTPWVYKDDMPKNLELDEHSIEVQERRMNLVARVKLRMFESMMERRAREREEEEREEEARRNKA